MSSDRTLDIQMQRLHRLTVWVRWIVLLLLWLTVGSWSLWQLRREIGLWIDYFTWPAVWYGLWAHLWPRLGLALCLGATIAVLVWQSRNILWGFPPAYRKRLQKQVLRIREAGPQHPLWKWTIAPSREPSSS